MPRFMWDSVELQVFGTEYLDLIGEETQLTVKLKGRDNFPFYLLLTQNVSC